MKLEIMPVGNPTPCYKDIPSGSIFRLADYPEGFRYLAVSKIVKEENPKHWCISLQDSALMTVGADTRVVILGKMRFEP